MKRTLTLTLFSLLLLTVGCQRTSQQASQSDLQIEVEPMSTSVGDTILMVTVTDADGNPIDDATVDVKGDMTHAGMEPVLTEVEGGENGVYALPYEWTMAGDWYMTVNVTLPDGSTASQQFDGFSISGEGDMDDMEMDHSEMEMDDESMEMDDDSAETSHDHADHDHDDHVTGTIPNDGAVIRIVTPTDSETVAGMVTVEVETENFDLNAEGNHWHLYLNDSLEELVREGNTFMLHDLAPGEYTLMVTMSNPAHEELEDGDMITFTVE